MAEDQAPYITEEPPTQWQKLTWVINSNPNRSLDVTLLTDEDGRLTGFVVKASNKLVLTSG